MQRIGCNFSADFMEVILAALKKLPGTKIWVAKSSQSGKREDEENLFLWKISLQRRVQTALITVFGKSLFSAM